MTRVFVLDNNKNPLMPCSPTRARELLTAEKAAVFQYYPFTIILKMREGGLSQPIECKIDPGSKTTGIAIVADFLRGKRALWAANFHHRAAEVKNQLLSRRSLRRSRRSRQTRYRAARFDNRKKKGFPPSLRSISDNVKHLVRRLQKLVPIEIGVIETARFDMQKMQNPEISGIEYTQGTLAGVEAKEYLLQKYNHTCVYCDAQNVPLEIDHVRPRSLGGSNRIGNLAIACVACNLAKRNQTIEQFVKDPLRRSAIEKEMQCSLAPAAHVNTLRKELVQILRDCNLMITESTGAITKWNRSKQGYPKDHWIDAACAGSSGISTFISNDFIPLEIFAKGRGSRQKCRVDKYGFPRTTAKKEKRCLGFQTGDMAKAMVPEGTKKGTYLGRLAIRSNGYFNIHTKTGVVEGIHARYCHRLQHMDGYAYKEGSPMSSRTTTSKKEKCYV